MAPVSHSELGGALFHTPMKGTAGARSAPLHLLHRVRHGAFGGESCVWTHKSVMVAMAVLILMLGWVDWLLLQRAACGGISFPCSVQVALEDVGKGLMVLGLNQSTRVVAVSAAVSAGMDFSTMCSNPAAGVADVRGSVVAHSALRGAGIVGVQELTGGRLWTPPAREAVVPRDRQLAEALEAAATEAGQVVLVVASVAYQSLLDNFLHHAGLCGLGWHVVVVALDAETVQAVGKGKGGNEAGGRARVGAVLDMRESGNLGTSTVKDVQPGENAVHVIRYDLLVRALRLGYRVLSCHLDVVWLRNPFRPPLFAEEEWDVFVPSATREAGHRLTLQAHEGCAFVTGGVVYSAPRMTVVEMYEHMKRALRASPEQSEAALLSSLLLLSAQVRWHVLEPLLFPSGFLYFDQSLPQLYNITPVAVHANWPASPVGGIRTKVYHLREVGLWALDEQLAGTGPGGARRYIAWLDMLYNNGLNNKRQALREGLAIAALLNRTVILPQLHRNHHVASPVLLSHYFNYEVFSDTFPNHEPHRFLDIAFPNWRSLPVHHIDIKLGLPAGASKEPWFATMVNVTPVFNPIQGSTETELLEFFGKKDDPLLILTDTFRRFSRHSDMAVYGEFNKQAYRGLSPSHQAVALADVLVSRLQQRAEKDTGLRQYNCFHLRRGDFLKEHPEHELPDVRDIAKMLRRYLQPEVALYVATDEPAEETRKAFLDEGFRQVMLMSDVFPPQEKYFVEVPEGGLDMRAGQVDQRVCAAGEKFVGNHYSTFTFHIAYLREMYGKEQVCQDIYNRTKPEGMLHLK